MHIKYDVRKWLVYGSVLRYAGRMASNENIYYKAYLARDARFDGVFFIGVSSTGIYCRPVCPAKTPKFENCTFFESAAVAQAAGFRPCLRCKPELAPGLAPMDDAKRIAQLLVQRLDEGMAEGGMAGEGADIETVAAQFDISSRQLRRIVKGAFGVSPLQLVQTRRLVRAKQLLGETALPITQVAFASGFSSLRRFNAAFLTQYGFSPRQARRQGKAQEKGAESTLLLGYRPPYDWTGILEFLQTRALAGVEHVTHERYTRTVLLDGHEGWIEVAQQADKNALTLTFSHSLCPVLPALLRRVRGLFDADARPDIITAQLGADVRLRKLVKDHPGLRVPGAFDGFELALRAILGQQVTVKAATTLAGRMAERFGMQVKTPFAHLSRLSPAPERLARAKIDDIAKLGVVSMRAKSIIALAQAVVQGELKLEAGSNPEKTMVQLMALPGIGPWTAHYIAMRALGWPDAFPKEDIAVRAALGGLSAKEAEAASQPWRPWRSYAVLHLWRGEERKK